MPTRGQSLQPGSPQHGPDIRSTSTGLYPQGVPDAENIAALIDGTLGEGSPFDKTFGYDAQGVGARTACLPDDWKERPITFDAGSR